MDIKKLTFETNPMGETVVISKPEFLEPHLHGNRIHSLNKAFEAMKIEFPEIVGGTLYGSMANGYVHRRSDVDMTIFIDVEKNGLGSRSFDKTLEIGGLDTSYIKLKPDFLNVYSNYTSEMIRKYLDIPNEVVLAHIKCLPISQGIVTEEIMTLVKYERDILIQYEREDRQTVQGEKQIMSSPKLYNPADQIGQLFMLQVGGKGIDSYRRTVIRLLSEHTDVADQCWKVIRLTLLAFENIGGYGLPARFEDAKLLFLEDS